MRHLRDGPACSLSFGANEFLHPWWQFLAATESILPLLSCHTIHEGMSRASKGAQLTKRGRIETYIHSTKDIHVWLSNYLEPTM